jgi:hypothetical protein
MKYILMDDEADEKSRNIPTTTYVLDVSNLRNPRYVGEHRAETMAIDHNQYIVGSYSYQANNNAGLRILRIDDPENPQNGLVEEAFFDIEPNDDSAESGGAWGVYPYFSSGIVLVSSTSEGLYVLRPHLRDALCARSPEGCEGEVREEEEEGSTSNESVEPTPVCKTDQDCRSQVFSNYCGGCNCDALHVDEAIPTSCPDGTSLVNCFADPCTTPSQHTASCGSDGKCQAVVETNSLYVNNFSNDDTKSYKKIKIIAQSSKPGGGDDGFVGSVTIPEKRKRQIASEYVDINVAGIGSIKLTAKVGLATSPSLDTKYRFHMKVFFDGNKVAVTRRTMLTLSAYESFRYYKKNVDVPDGAQRIVKVEYLVVKQTKIGYKNALLIDRLNIDQGVKGPVAPSRSAELANGNGDNVFRANTPREGSI